MGLSSLLSAQKSLDLEFYASVRAVSIANRYISVENWFIRASNFSKRLTSATNRAFSVQHACGLSTTPTLLA